MKCEFCETTIDEKRDMSQEIAPDRRAWSDKVSSWQYIVLSIRRNGGLEVLKDGHVCPDCASEVNGNNIEILKG